MSKKVGRVKVQRLHKCADGGLSRTREDCLGHELAEFFGDSGLTFKDLDTRRAIPLRPILLGLAGILGLVIILGVYMQSEGQYQNTVISYFDTLVGEDDTGTVGASDLKFFTDTTTPEEGVELIKTWLCTEDPDHESC